MSLGLDLLSSLEIVDLHTPAPLRFELNTVKLSLAENTQGPLLAGRKLGGGGSRIEQQQPLGGHRASQLRKVVGIKRLPMEGPLVRFAPGLFFGLRFPVAAENTLIGKAIVFFEVIFAPSQPVAPQGGGIAWIEPDHVGNLHRILEKRVHLHVETQTQGLRPHSLVRHTPVAGHKRGLRFFGGQCFEGHGHRQGDRPALGLVAQLFPGHALGIEFVNCPLGLSPGWRRRRAKHAQPRSDEQQKCDHAVHAGLSLYGSVQLWITGSGSIATIDLMLTTIHHLSIRPGPQSHRPSGAIHD